MKNWAEGNNILVDNRIVLSGARIFECIKNDGAFITVQEHSVDIVDGEIWVGWDWIGKPMRKKLRFWDGGTAYFLPKPSKRNEIAQQWGGKRLILNEPWSF